MGAKRIALLAPILYIGNQIIDTQYPGKPDLVKNQQTFTPIAATRHHPTAKNVAQAVDFGRETLRILEWLQGQTELTSLLSRDPNRVRAGAYRLNARYLLDGGMPWPALKSYTQASLAWPGFALKHWHRMIYAIFCILRIDGLTNPIRRLSSTHRRKRLIAELRRYHLSATRQKASSETGITTLGNWPGLNLEI